MTARRSREAEKQIAAALRKLSDERAIETLIPRYAHIVDDRRFAALGEVFHPEAVIDLGEAGEKAGLETIIAWIEALPPPRAHLFTNISVTDLDAASARLRSTGSIFRTDGSVGIVRFDDRVERHGAGWRIRNRRIEIRP